MDLHLTRIDEPRNTARYYELEVTGNLFGGAGIIRRWGRIGAVGRERRCWFTDRDDAEAAEAARDVWARNKRR